MQADIGFIDSCILIHGARVCPKVSAISRCGGKEPARRKRRRGRERPRDLLRPDDRSVRALLRGKGGLMNPAAHARSWAAKRCRVGAMPEAKVRGRTAADKYSRALSGGAGPYILVSTRIRKNKPNNRAARSTREAQANADSESFRIALFAGSGRGVTVCQLRLRACPRAG